MIIPQIIGGLGNQMFQYAMARSLSITKNVALKVDISPFKNYQLHQGFELQKIFNSSIEIATAKDFQEVLAWRHPYLIRKLLSRPDFKPFRNKAFIVEPYFNYWDEINGVPDQSYLIGYWQSEKYFSRHTEQIREDFSFKDNLDNINLDLHQKITQTNAVSLHIRRGDYASNSKTTEVHGLTPISYYQSAIEHIAERVTNPHFYIFSDDIGWVKNNLKIIFPHLYVDHNKNERSYNDLRLMSACQHHIIANSSFSWWGAWLNPRRNKIVIAPKQWFNKNTNVGDLLPSDWIRL